MRKSIILVFAFAFRLVSSSQNISVDASQIVKSFDHNPCAINLDYLMDDDSYLHPQLPMIQSLKNLNVQRVRYPGGEKADNYLWSVALYSSAKPQFAVKGNCNWPNSDSRFSSDYLTPLPTTLDFDELANMCAATGIKPLIVVAGDAQYCQKCPNPPTTDQLVTNAAEWVRYANVVKKLNIKYWMVGNESWNSAVYDKPSTAQQYADDFVKFSKAMKAVDTSICVVANTQAGTWMTTLMNTASNYVDAVALSNYPVNNWTAGYNTFKNGNPSFTSDINSISNSIGTKKIDIIVSEYNSIDWGKKWEGKNDMGHALVNFKMLGDILNAPKVVDAYLWNTRWVDNNTNPQNINDALDSDGNLNAIGNALSLWAGNWLNKIVYSTSSGFVNSYALTDETGKYLNLFLINRDSVTHSVQVDISNFTSISSVSGMQLSAVSDKVLNPTFSSKAVQKITANTLQLSLDPYSINVFKINQPSTTQYDETTVSSFVVWPNPASDVLNLKFSTNLHCPKYIKLLSPTGIVIKTMPIPNDQSQFQFPVGDIPSGFYLVQVGDIVKSLVLS